MDNSKQQIIHNPFLLMQNNYSKLISGFWWSFTAHAYTRVSCQEADRKLCFQNKLACSLQMGGQDLDHFIEGHPVVIIQRSFILVCQNLQCPDWESRCKYKPS